MDNRSWHHSGAARRGGEHGIAPDGTGIIGAPELRQAGTADAGTEGRVYGTTTAGTNPASPGHRGPSVWHDHRRHNDQLALTAQKLEPVSKAGHPTTPIAR